MTAGKQSYFIPRRPLILLAIAMLFTVPAMFGNLVTWVPTLFLGSLLVRFYMDWRGMRLRSILLKLCLLAGGIGGVALSYQSLLGPEPGLSICLVLIGVKILEAHTARDFHVLAALGWFACVAEVMISQSLDTALYSGIAFALVLASVLQFHRHSSGRRAFLAPLRQTAVLILQALPLLVALFFLFPRGSGGLGFILKHSFSGRSGMSDSLSPGSVASLALNRDVAFRVEFPDGGMPSPSGMYWRGNVMTVADGMNWSPSKADLQWKEPEQMEVKPIRQRIVLQPHGGRWMFALDKPVRPPRDSLMVAGNVLLAKQAVRSTIQYEVVSLPESKPAPLSETERNVCLQTNALSPAVLRLAQSLAQAPADPNAIVAAGLQFFHSGKFSYSLTPGEYGKDALDEFLFRRQVGFCEHYAAAFATLMRAAGVPARIVLGYQGGEFNALGTYVIVRQSYAHAWCEVWVPDAGWKRVDPTAVVTPERVNTGFDSLQGAAAGEEAGALNRLGMAFGRRGFLHELQLAWDSLSYAWDSQVVSFDEGAQRLFLLQLGVFNGDPTSIIGWLILFVAAALAVQAFASWWKDRPARDPVVRLYERFCRKAEALGVRREPWEGPLQFAQRASELIPAQAEQIGRIAALYAALRYSANPDATEQAELARMIRNFCRGK